MRRLRDRTEFGRIARKAQLKTPTKRAVVEEVIALMVELRARFDQFVVPGGLSPRGYTNERCEAFRIQLGAAQVMNDLRERILNKFGSVAPGRVRLLPQRASRPSSI